MREARVAVVGAGYWGKNLVRNFHQLGALVAVCDQDDAALQRAASGYSGLRRYHLMADAIADPDVTAVAIATPAESHGRLAQAALAAGKAVYIEKPMCLELDDARAIDAMARERRLTLMVGHLLLYHPAFVALERFIAGGRLGDIRYVYSTRASLGRIRREENALWSFAPHDVSMILKLFGELPDRVVSNGAVQLRPPVADTSLTHLSFPGGRQAHIFVSWLHPFKEHRLVVVGDRGMAVFDDVRPGAEKLTHYPHIVSWEGGFPTVEEAAAVPIPFTKDEPLRIECQHFVDCVQTGATPRSGGREGIRVLSVLVACQRSLASGQPVGIDDHP